MDKFIEYFNEHQFSFIMDMIIIALLLAGLVFISFKRLRKEIAIILPILFVLLILAEIFLNLEYAMYATRMFILCTILILLFVSREDNNSKKRIQILPEKKNLSRYVSSEEEKNKIIDVLVKTCEYFGQRKVGALITIEQENSLNTYIDKAVKLDAEITPELLKTIFFPNTALHDGAVIIRGNRIVCATAFYTPSDKADIERDLGSRHRAAIGISEDSDAFTIVVSEETGQISTTSRGTIERDKSIDALRVALSQHILVEKSDK